MKKYLELLEQSNGLKELLVDTNFDLNSLTPGVDSDLKRNTLREKKKSVLEELGEIKLQIKDNEQKRTNKEFRRLNKIFKEYANDNFTVVSGLMNRAAFMRVQLENYEHDIIVNGSVEPFSQGDQSPYDRARPVVQQYATMNSNYQKIIKQLSDLLPDNNKTDDIRAVINEFKKPT